MSETNSPLENMHIASPCHASWDAMTGDDKARFCATCQKNVFNISMMTRTEAEQLLRQREGNLCVRYAQREDGTIITEDCPVGVEKAKYAAMRPWRFFVAGVAGIIATICGVFGVTPSFAQPPINPPAKSSAKTHEVKGDIGPKSATPIRMGEAVAAPPKCPSPTDTKIITMGKPAITNPPVVMMQGGMAPPPAPTPAPVIMGKIVAPQTTTPTKPVTKTPVKPATKKATPKKVVAKKPTPKH